MDIAGRGMVVTGAAGGIGLALATEFHRRGATVVLADVKASAIETAVHELDARRPGSALGFVADVSTEDGNRELIDLARRALRESSCELDLFFANAGIGGGTLVESTTEAEWDMAFRVNLHAHRWAAKHLLPEWLARGHGYFCSTASAAGLLSQIGSAPYSVTKHGAVAFAEWLAITYGDRGLRVSCLCPQGVNTDMLKGDGGTDGVGAGATDVVRAAGVVLEPSQVATVVADCIEAETFLVLPHPEVARYEQARSADRARWLAGMRKLQARIVGTPGS